MANMKNNVRMMINTANIDHVIRKSTLINCISLESSNKFHQPKLYYQTSEVLFKIMAAEFNYNINYKA